MDWVRREGLWSTKIVYLQKAKRMIIERTSKEVIFRLPSSTKLKDLQEIADLFTFREISQKSKASQKEVDNLVKKIKKGRWNKSKEKIGL
jgi:NAD-dependent DNA ligase